MRSVALLCAAAVSAAAGAHSFNPMKDALMSTPLGRQLLSSFSAPEETAPLSFLNLNLNLLSFGSFKARETQAISCPLYSECDDCIQNVGRVTGGCAWCSSSSTSPFAGSCAASGSTCAAGRTRITSEPSCPGSNTPSPGGGIANSSPGGKAMTLPAGAGVGIILGVLVVGVGIAGFLISRVLAASAASSKQPVVAQKNPLSGGPPSATPSPFSSSSAASTAGFLGFLASTVTSAEVRKITLASCAAAAYLTTISFIAAATTAWRFYSVSAGGVSGSFTLTLYSLTACTADVCGTTSTSEATLLAGMAITIIAGVLTFAEAVVLTLATVKAARGNVGAAAGCAVSNPTVVFGLSVASFVVGLVGIVIAGVKCALLTDGLSVSVAGGQSFSMGIAVGLGAAAVVTSAVLLAFSSLLCFYVPKLAAGNNNKGGAAMAMTDNRVFRPSTSSPGTSNDRRPSHGAPPFTAVPMGGGM